MNSIQSKWDIFRTRVIHHGAPQIQKDEMKMAYYAGASSFFELEMEITRMDLDDDESAALIEKLHIELQEFAKQKIAEAIRKQNG